MNPRNLPTVPIAPDLHARLTIAAAEHTPLVADVRERLRLLVEPVLAELASRFEARPEFHQPSRFCFCGGPGCSWHRVEVEILPGGTMVALADSVAVRVDKPDDGSTRWLNLDGNIHIAGDLCPSCKRDLRPCPKCGWPVHWSPVYGGIADACEKCEAWDVGQPPPHDDCGIVIDQPAVGGRRQPTPCTCADGVECSCGGAR